VLPESTVACADLSEACRNELWRYGPSRKHVRKHSRTVAPALAEPFWDFSEESRCLALLEPDTLDELVLFYGASLHAPEIARVILGKELARLREALGERAHSYALQRGQYRMPVARGEFAARDRELPLAERVVLHGKEAFGIIVAGWPQTLQRRVQTVLAVVLPPETMPVSAALQNGIWFDMKKILLTEVASAWAPCFA
jgi:hypothetical protein